MPKAIRKWPLLALLEKIKEWHDSAGSDTFWDPEAEHFIWMDSLRAEAKVTIIWLELKNQLGAAARLDSAIKGWRETALNYKSEAQYAYPPEDPRCRKLRDEMVGAAGVVMGACEDLDAELPPEIWEGFGDE